MNVEALEVQVERPARIFGAELVSADVVPAENFLVLSHTVVFRPLVGVAQHDGELALVEGVVVDDLGKVDVAFELQNKGVGKLREQRNDGSKPHSLYRIHYVVRVGRFAAELCEKRRQRFIQSELGVGVARNVEPEFELDVDGLQVVRRGVFLRIETFGENRSAASGVVEIYRELVNSESQCIITYI